ncbi:MAG TPA: glycerophosphodiester phosphodiesterase family protein [Flavisolibacter sp.]|nr:glycerophosphodiester phosphodiesterase family protein [Flavisolibacter sp.]
MKLFPFTLLILFLSCTSPKKIGNFNSITFDKQGHRGSRGLMPENTIPAMLKAIDLDVTTLEMDVVISKDNKVVVSHDPHFHENITTTPDGKYLTKAQGASILLFHINYDSIRKYDVGLKPHPDYPRQEKIAVYKPLLNELIAATEAYARQKGKTLFYNIEIKSKPENYGKKQPQVEEFVSLAVDVITRGGILNRTTVQSFDFIALQALHNKYPRIRSSMLIESFDKRNLDEQLSELGYTPEVYSPHFSLVTAQLIQQCHSKNMKVIPWTVNSLDEMKRLKQMGVDGIITDYPDLFQQL